MASIGVAIPYLGLAGLGVALLFGSILAVRGRRWWATVVMVVGAGMQVAASLVMAGGSVWMLMEVTSLAGTSSPSSPSRMASAMTPMLIVTIIGALLLGLGLLLFAAGFIGFCARTGSLERRARELESVVAQLQEHREG